MGQKFSSEGRNLLSVAYKNVVGSRRNAWRVITGNLQQMKDDGAKARATEYQKCIQEELTCLCKEVVVCFVACVSLSHLSLSSLALLSLPPWPELLVGFGLTAFCGH